MPHAFATTASSIPTCLWSAVGQHPGGTWERLPTLFFFLPLTPAISLTTSASCIPLSYSLPIVHFVTVCFTLDHLLCHSHSPTSIKSLSPISVSLSGKQLFLSAQPTLSLFTGSSSCSLTPPRLLLFILLPRSIPLSSPLIQAHSALFQLYCALAWNLDDHPTSTPPCRQPPPSLSLFFQPHASI